MGELITYAVRKVKVRGLNRSALPDQRKVKEYLFERDYHNLRLLQKIAPFSFRNATMLYPGAGVDILFPVLYLEHLFPALQHVTMLLVDTGDNSAVIKTILDDLGISFAEKRKKIAFYWKGMRVEAEFKVRDIFELLPTLPSFDIYFERAFRIIRDEKEGYEEAIVGKLRPGGVLISDSGFENFTALKYIPVPKELSSYGEMVIGVKK